MYGAGARAPPGYRIIAHGMGTRWSQTTKLIVIAAIFVAALFVLWRAGDIVQPFLWATILSYILLPVVGALEKRFALPRTLAALAVFLGLLAVIFGGFRLIVPRLVDNAKDLESSWPALVGNAEQTISDTFDDLGLGDLNDVVIGPTLHDLERQLAGMASRNALPFV